MIRSPPQARRYMKGARRAGAGIHRARRGKRRRNPDTPMRAAKRAWRGIKAMVAGADRRRAHAIAASSCSSAGALALLSFSASSR